MPTEILNLDALGVETVPVEKTIDGAVRRWDLRTAPSSGVMLWGLLLSQLGEKLQDAATRGEAAEIRRLQADLKERTLYLCTEIFQATYPTVTDEEVAAWFTHDERFFIVQYFMSPRSSESSAPPNDGGATLATGTTRTRTTTSRKSRSRRA